MAKLKLPASENLVGITLMIAGMASGAAVDVTVKALSAQADIMLIASVIGFGMAAIFALAVRRDGQTMVSQQMLHPAVLLRTVFEVLGIYATVLALSMVSLTSMTALLQSVPLLITVGAVLFFRERAGLGDWAVLLLGFLGMILIVKPGTGSFQPATLIAVAAAFILAARDLASRAVPAQISTLQLGVLGGAALGVGTLAVVIFTGISLPSPSIGLGIGLVAVIMLASTTFYCITAAMRLGSVAVISPFRYTRLIFGTLLGMMVFGEKLDLATVVGGIAIVASGLYVWSREVRGSTT